MCTRQPYSTDLSDGQWAVLETLVPACKPGGRPPKYTRREIVNAILYVLRAGCAWTLVPHDLPNGKTAYHYFRTWRIDGTWQAIHDELRGDLREAVGRERDPSAGTIDSQSVKTSFQGGERGYDGAKQTKGRKRNLLVDVLGLVILATVLPANVQDSDGAMRLLEPLRTRLSRLQLIWAAGGYNRVALRAWLSALRKRRNLSTIRLQIVRRPHGAKGFVVLPRRWVVGRTFAWLGRYRRMSKDFEVLPATSEAMICVAMSDLMSRRLAAL